MDALPAAMHRHLTDAVLSLPLAGAASAKVRRRGCLEVYRAFSWPF